MFMNKVSFKRNFKITLMFIIVLALYINISDSDAANTKITRPSAKDIPSSSLIIGTHIISFKALNSELLNIALKSAEESDQLKTYYKSEFAKGSWFDISSASSFADISSSGSPVTNSEIDSLKLTHWTKDDGITIELATGSQVDVHKIIDYRDPSNLLELEELKTQKELLQNMKRTEDDDNKLSSINKIFNRVDVQDYTDLDLQLDKITKYIEYLKSVKKEPDEVIEIPQRMKSSLNTGKILTVYSEIAKRLQNESTYAEKVVTTGEGKDKKITKNAYTDLSTKYWTALDLVQKKIVELENQIGDSVTASPLASEKKAAEKKLLESILSDDNTGADKMLKRAYSIQNILSNLVLDADYELSILDPVKDSEIEKLISMAKKGDSDEYIKAKKAGNAAPVLLSLKGNNMAAIEESGSNVDELIEYIKQRRTDQSDVVSLLEGTRNEYIKTIPSVPKCDSQKQIVDYLRSLIDKLSKEIASINAGMSEQQSSSMNGELDQITEQIKLLNNKYMDAIEKGDMELAATIEDNISDLANKQNSIQSDALNQYKGLLEQKSALDAAMQAAIDNNDPEKMNSIQSDLDIISTKLLAMEPSLDGKTKLLSDLYNTALNSLNDAIINGEYNTASNLAEELGNISSKLPDDFKGKGGKETDLKNLNKLTDNRYVDLVAMGDLSSAKKVKALQSTINQALINHGDSPHDYSSGNDSQGSSSGTGTNQSNDSQGTSSGTGTNQGNDSQGTSSGTGTNQGNDSQGTSSGTGTNQGNDSQGSSSGTGGSQGSGNYQGNTDSGNEIPYVDGLNEVMSAAEDSESTLGLDYIGDIDLITDPGLKKHRLIVRLIILQGLKAKPEFKELQNAIDILMSDIVRQLKNLERDKYESFELLSAEKNRNGYNLLGLDSFIIDQSNSKHLYSIAVKSGTIFVPLRSLADSIKARVLWNPSTGEVTLVKNNLILVFKADSKSVTVNGRNEAMSHSAANIDGVTYVPLDYILGKMDMVSLWRPQDMAVVLYSKALAANE